MLFNIKRCKYKLKCKFNYGEYTKINSNDQLDLHGSCLNCLVGESLDFKYKLYSRTLTSDPWVFFAKENFFFTSGQSFSDLTLKEELFGNYSSYKYWKIELMITKTGRNVTGVSSVVFYVNFPPHLGQCFVEPNAGTTLTQFSINCVDWIDSDGSLVNFAFYG